jgi:hypothetical protein
MGKDSTSSSGSVSTAPLSYQNSSECNSWSTFNTSHHGYSSSTNNSPAAVCEKQRLLLPTAFSTSFGTSDEQTKSKCQEKRLVPVFLVVFLLAALATIAFGPLLSHKNINQRQNPSPDHQYTATQFISFTINTFGGLDAKHECDDEDFHHDISNDADDEVRGCYLGNVHNLTEDVEHRFQLLLKVLDTLENDGTKKATTTLERDDDSRPTTRIDHSEHTLKVFMVPEFFLRGPMGAYPIEELFHSGPHNESGLLLDIAERIHDRISSPYWEHWMFVFGTVVAVQLPNDDTYNDPTIPNQPWELHVQADQVLYYNFAPVFRGGSSVRKGEQGPERFIITKHYYSSIDFLNGVSLPNPKHHNQFSYYNELPQDFVDLLSTKNSVVLNHQDSVLNIDNIRLGIEICLDHLEGVLWKQIQNQSLSSPETEVDSLLVDVLLITSAGMTIEYGPSPIVPGGVVYMTDGGATSAACYRPVDDESKYDPHSVCRTPPPTQVKHYPPVPPTTNGKTNASDYSQFFTMATCTDVLSANDLRGYFSLYQPMGCTYTLQDFGIEVYDPATPNLPSLEYYPVVSLPGR